MSAHRAAGFARHGSSLVVFIWLTLVAPLAASEPLHGSADALLAIDQQRASVVERIVDAWGPLLARSSASVSVDELRTRLMALRADRLFAASLAGTLDGLREVLGVEAESAPSLKQTKALGESTRDVVYTPVTPCRLVETRGVFAAVYQGDGTPAHTPRPFASNEVRTYTVQGGNGACLAQLPASLAPSAVQLQVFGIPTTPTSGDIEILPQGTAFGSTATMVYVSILQFNTVSTAAKINTANKQISVQVRGGGAHLAIDVVGYFAAPTGTGGNVFLQGGNGFGTTATLGTLDDQPLSLVANNQPVATYLPNADSPNIVSGRPSNAVNPADPGQTIAGGGAAGNDCIDAVSRQNNHSCSNRTAASYATVGGGFANLASGFAATVTGGSGNTANGSNSTVAGGFGNFAGVSGTFAAGSNAYANLIGCAAIAFWSTSTSMPCEANNHVRIGANHGISVDYFAQTGFGIGERWVSIGDLASNRTINTWTGGSLSNGGVWTNASDRTKKENFAPVNARDILARVAALPVTQWNYRNEPGVQRIGPVAQDFHAAFGLGSDDKTIGTGDEMGVALAAIQGLHQLMQEKDARIDALERTIEALKAAVATLTARR
jgi:hypothetical protein